jgi:hypothetical protein
MKCRLALSTVCCWGLSSCTINENAGPGVVGRDGTARGGDIQKTIYQNRTEYGSVELQNPYAVPVNYKIGSIAMGQLYPGGVDAVTVPRGKHTVLLYNAWTQQFLGSYRVSTHDEDEGLADRAGYRERDDPDDGYGRSNERSRTRYVDEPDDTDPTNENDDPL